MPEVLYRNNESEAEDKEPPLVSMVFVDFLAGHPELLVDTSDNDTNKEVPFYKPMATEYTQEEIENAPRTPSAKLTQLYSRDMYREKEIADDTKPDYDEEE